MTKQEISALLHNLKARFGKEYPSVSKQLIEEELADEPIEAARKAYERIKGKESYLPSPNDLINEIRHNSALIRESIAAKERRENKQPENFLTRKHNSELAKRSCLLSLGILSGMMTREQFLEGIRIMDDSYPNLGWAKVGSEVKRFFDG